MIQALKSNPKTTIWGFLTILSEILRNNPDLINFLPDNIKGYVLGISTIIFAVMTAASARDADSSKVITAKAVAKEMDKQELKEEILTETAVMVHDAQIPKAKEIPE